MRVLHIAQVEKIAGAERHLLHLLPALKKEGIDAEMLCIFSHQPPPAAFIDELQAGDVPVHSLKLPQTTPLISPKTPNTIRQLAKFIRTRQPDAIHTHLYHGDFWGGLAGWWARVPVRISTRHNVDSYRQKRQWGLLAKVFTQNVAIAQAVADFTHTAEHVPYHKITIIYHGITPPIPMPKADARQQLNLPADALVIGTVARLTAQKGLDNGINAFARIADDFPNAHYILAGDGDLQQALTAQADALGLSERIHFLGWQADTTPVYCASDLFLLPSLWEGVPYVLLEAMGHRLPIIASAVNALPEIIVDGETGLLTPPKDVEKIAHALQKLLSDEPLRGRMGEGGYTRLTDQFTLQAMVNRHVALYLASGK